MMPHFVLLVACGLTLTQSGFSREDTERILRTARITSMAYVGQGISGSRRVELEANGSRLRAIFKAVDNRFESEFPFGRETAPVFRDSYKHEIAAYELDKLLGLGMVPPAVEREIDGERGSLQIWFEQKWLRFVHGQQPPDRRRADDDVHAVRLLDYLIFNTDRHPRNLFFGEGWRPVMIDHSISFHPMKIPCRPLYRFPREVVARLRGLDPRQLENTLGRYLEKDQIQALEQRRQFVIDLVATAIAERGEANVLFDWPADRNRYEQPRRK